MLLRNTHILGDDKPVDIRIADGKITSVEVSDERRSDKDDQVIDLAGTIAFPGLINSHDHLDFNLFPKLGNKIYNNYREWGKDIQENSRQQIDDVLKIPLELRVKWGMYKNLLNGVTTVVNHGDKLDISDDFVSVIQNYHPLHSVGFEKNWKLKLNDPFKNTLPFVIHVGEGTDDTSYEEINELIKWNLFNKKIIGVHGVAMTVTQAKEFEALIWCPGSNYFMLNKTADIDSLKHNVKVIFGTDSTLTSSWNLWEHFRLAKQSGFIHDEELLNMVTTTPAEIWGLNQQGKIKESYQADLIIAESPKKSAIADLFGINPQNILLVMRKGNILLFDQKLQGLTSSFLNPKSYCGFNIRGTTKYVIGNIPELASKIRAYYPGVQFPIEMQ